MDAGDIPFHITTDFHGMGDVTPLTIAVDHGAGFINSFGPDEDAMGRGVREPPPMRSAMGKPAAWPAISQQAMSIGLLA